MTQRRCGIALALLAACSSALAGAIVETEQISDREWTFRKVLRPSRSDAARDAKITVTGDRPASSCLSPDGLHNGVLPQQAKQIRDFFCFSNESAGDGRIVMDLGSVLPIAAVNSYSAHGPPWFDGSRAPQVYTLFGSAMDRSDPADLSNWVEIAKVDTRPDDTGRGWGGQWGVNIKDDQGGLLGNFRWLAWDVKRTLSLRQKPEWTGTWYCELDVHTPETLKTAGDAVLAGTQLKEIVLSFKTHYDIGFTHPAPEIVNIYRTSMIDQALRTIEQSRNLPPEQRFAWTVPSWPLWQILWPGQTPERRAKVVQALKEGSLVIHGLPVTLQTESLDLEDLVAGLAIHARICREIGLPISRAGKMTDVPSHSWIWPTVFKHAGMDFLHIGVNSCNERPDVPLLYYWQGPDGSRLLTMHNQGYGSDVEQGAGLYPPKDWPYRHWLAMVMTSDNQGPPSAGQVQNLLAEAARNLPGVKVRLGRMEDFADAIFEEEKGGASIPVVRADMPDTWIHGMLSMPQMDAVAHRARPLLSAVETLDSHLRAWGLPRPDIRDQLFAAHERSFMYGEHTWGGARNLQGRNAYAITNFEEFVKTDGTCQYLQRTWDDHAAYIEKTAAIADKLARKELGQLAAGVNRSGKRVVVFNPLPRKRDAIVETTDGRFLAKDLPACGYRAYATDRLDRTDRSDTNAATIENRFLKVTLDRARGGIVSIVEKKTGRELVEPAAPHAFGQYLYERFDKIQNDAYNQGTYHNTTVYGLGSYGWNNRIDLPAGVPYTNAVPAYRELTVQRDGVAQTAILRADAAGLIRSKVTTTITLPDHAPWLEIAIQLDDKEPDYWPEAGSFFFPVNAAQPQFRIGRLGGLVDPAKDFARGANRTYGYVNTGALVAGADGRGVGLCPLDHGIMSFGEKGLCTIDPDYVPTTPVARVSFFNNLWTINFPYWIKGSLHSRVRVWPTENLDPSSLVDRALEARSPVLVGEADGPAGPLPAEASGLALSRDGVRVTTFGPNRDGTGTVLRVWEQAGKAGELTVTLPGHFETATPVNLRGEKSGAPLTIRDGRIAFDLPAYAPASFVLTTELPVSAVVPGGPVTNTPLSGLDLSGISQGWGTPQIDKSAAGVPLKVGGVEFSKGLGSHAPMNWDIELDGQGIAFTAQVGLQDHGVKGKGSVEFLVLGDGQPLFKSPVLRSGDAAVPVKVDLAGVQTLTLQVSNGGDGMDADHADWIDAVLTHVGDLE
jgi:alpha-mannosidase